MYKKTSLNYKFINIFLISLLSLIPFSLFAQSNTMRIEGPLKLVIPFGPGSGTDVYARMVGQSLSQAMGTAVIIDNRPGASGVLAADFVAKAKPDGNTLLLTTNTTHAANPHLIKDLRYDPVRDFAPISKLGNLTFFLGINSPTFESCVNDNKYGDNVEKLYASMAKNKVEGTPTVFINGKLWSRSGSEFVLDEFKAAVEAAKK